METDLRAALIAWLRSDAVLANLLNAVTEEAPSRASPPWLGIAASASGDWSTKDRMGREVLIAFEIHCRGDDPGTAAAVTRAVEARIEALPRAQAGFAVATVRFLRARAEQRRGNVRAVLLEYRFRVLAD
ncbi:MAG: DUF3168 domain-containing protein [Novosphingobium sp.]|nr:DUF3168 domain-containing protein [Novosphingobium sp.]